MMLDMGGDQPSKLLQFCRANVLCVLNLTHASEIVQFSSVHITKNSLSALQATGSDSAASNKAIKTQRLCDDLTVRAP